MSYEVLFITKGGVTLDIPLCDSWTILMTLQLHYINFYVTYDCFHCTNDTWSFTLQQVYKNTFSTYTHVGQNWLESARQDNTKTRMPVERLAHQPPLRDPR